MQAVIVPSATQDMDQWVSVGVHYGGDTMLWVATKRLETLIDPSVVYTSEGEVTGLPDTLAQGQSAVVTATIATVNPSADISFLIYNPLGFDDVFDIGKPEIEIGSSFGCSETKEWKPDMRRSLSGESVGYVQYNLPFAMNIDAARDVSKAENKIQIKFSLTAMKGVDTAGQYVFSVVMSVGIDDVISVTQDISITDTLHSPPVGAGQISLISPTLLGTAYAGGTAAFQVGVTLPAGKSFELKTSGSVSNEQIKPSGLAIISAGVCSGFLQEAIFDNSLESNFGIVTNADSSASTIELMVVFELSEAATGQISEAITIDGVSATMTGAISPAPAELGDVVGTGTGLGLVHVNNKTTIMPGFAVGVRSEVVLPASVLNKPLTLEVFQESQQPDHIRLCRIEVEQVGLGHPCTIPFKDYSFAETHVTFSQSVDTMEEADMVMVNAGHTCPVGVPNNPKVNASLVFSFYYEIPIEDSESVSEGTSFVFAGGLFVDQTALWTTHIEAEKIEPYPPYERDQNGWVYGMEAWDDSQTLTRPYLSARIINEKVSIFGIVAVRFVIKLNKFTRGKIYFNLQTNIAPAAAATCSLKVVRIGKNFGCAKSPEEYTRENVRSGSGTFLGRSGYPTVLEIENLMNYGPRDLQSNMYADDDSIDLMAFFRIIKDPGDNPIQINAVLNGQERVVEFPNIEPTPMTYNQDFDVDIIPVQADETLASAPLHAAKTIAMEVTIPQLWNFYNVRFYSDDTDFDEKITMCSMQVTKVGKNLPCLSTWVNYDKNYYTNKVEPISRITENGKKMEMKVEVCHFDYSRDPEENKFQVEFTFKPTMKANEGDVINIVAEIESVFEPIKKSKTQSITLSNSVSPSNFLISKSIFPRVMENTTLANFIKMKSWGGVYETEIEGNT